MSEPLRRSLPGVTEGEEPGEGIASPETVVPGTIGKTPEASADDQQADPGGHPHAPAASVPRVPTDAPTEPPADEEKPVREAREHVRDTGGHGSWGPAPE